MGLEACTRPIQVLLCILCDRTSDSGTLQDMEDEGENEFVSEQVNDIVKNAITKNLGNAQYNKDRVNTWCTSIIDDCLKDLAKLEKPFKYVVTCVIMQKNGSPMHTGTSLFWDTKTDGLSCMQTTIKDAAGMETMDCVTTIFATMI